MPCTFKPILLQSYFQSTVPIYTKNNSLNHHSFLYPLTLSLSPPATKRDITMQQKPFFFLLLSFVIWSWWSLNVVVSDPQTNYVKIGCSQYNVTDVSIFNRNLNATFRDLRNQISNQSKHFATAQAVSGNNPAYGLFQCRNYLSISDCLKCFDYATDHIRNCSVGVTGARIIYEGCFLRYIANFDFCFQEEHWIWTDM